MIAYTVYEPEELRGELLERADQVTFVREGFAWLALPFPVLWLLFHRMWLVLLAFLGLVVVLNLAAGLFAGGETIGGWMSLGLTVLLAFEANDLRRWTLERRGYRLAGTVSGRTRTECEQRFFTDWLDRTGASATAPRAKPHGPAARTTPPSHEPESVIGVFPEPGR